jgi:hypothetical protein
MPTLRLRVVVPAHKIRTPVLRVVLRTVFRAEGYKKCFLSYLNLRSASRGKTCKSVRSGKLLRLYTFLLDLKEHSLRLV